MNFCKQHGDELGFPLLLTLTCIHKRAQFVVCLSVIALLTLNHSEILMFFIYFMILLSYFFSNNYLSLFNNGIIEYHRLVHQPKF